MSADPIVAAHPATQRICVVVPVYRNRETLEELAARIAAACRDGGLEYRLLLVDDASPDDEWQTIVAMARADRRITGMRLNRNVGHQVAVLAGLAEATGDWLVCLDGDLQDPPEQIPRLISAAGPSIDVVFAGRCGQYQSRFRMLCSWSYRHLLSAFTGLPRDAGMFFAIRERAATRLFQYMTTVPSVLPMIAASGANVMSVPTRREFRPQGVSAYTNAARVRVGMQFLRCTLELHMRGPTAAGILPMLAACVAETTAPNELRA
jgi:cellulose synthase/poly-beta-1,6-N-acetylglucosamine synthase-like glycosyltransferase